jgi:uncharacterized membrane protein
MPTVADKRSWFGRRRGQALQIMIALWFIIGAIGLLAIDGVRYLQAQREVQAFAQSAARTGAQEINTQAFAYCRIGIDDCAWYIGFSARATTQAIAAGNAWLRTETACATGSSGCNRWGSIDYVSGTGSVTAVTTAAYPGTTFTPGPGNANYATVSGLTGRRPVITVTISSCVEASIISLTRLLADAGSTGCPTGTMRVVGVGTYEVVAGQ